MLIACLCARWCHICNGYRSTFDRVAAQWPEHAFRWIDIEDEAERVGNVDVEDFPTLLIRGDAGDVRFFGAVHPSESELQRLVRAAARHRLSAGNADVALLAARLG